MIYIFISDDTNPNPTSASWCSAHMLTYLLFVDVDKLLRNTL